MKKQFFYWGLFIFVILFLCPLGAGLIWERTQKKPFALSLLNHLEPWSVQSGRRIEILRQQVPTVNRVVIVPDAATFLAAMQQWSLKGRWPILIEDKRYTPMFIDRFKPDEVIRLPAVKKPLPKGETLRQQMMQVAAAAWDSENWEKLKEKWQQLGWEPPGVVMTWETDPAWPAAVALAADRGQPLVFLEGNFGKPNDTLPLEQWQSLKTLVYNRVLTTSYPAFELGDGIDAITIVRKLAVKYASPTTKDEQLAVTDGLARYDNGERWAVVGWIYGNASRAVYQAMSAIFLDPQIALLYNSYPLNVEPWNYYEMETPTGELMEMNFDVKLLQKPDAKQTTWQKIISQPWNVDLIVINSKGNPDKFDVGDGDVSFNSLPKLKFPAIVYFIHSWSATKPEDQKTIGARWLENGAYLYIGSVYEPYLNAFVTSKLWVKNIRKSMPLIMAARQEKLPPWKITTIGDPLMIIQPPRKRMEPSQLPLKESTVSH